LFYKNYKKSPASKAIMYFIFLWLFLCLNKFINIMFC